ncbi:MAG: AAA family ATPase [candidate division FCPU426 bacterium]
MKIENFRGLTSIEFETPSLASVIVGPNAVGKTSILESIRLCKALLMPSAGSEGQLVLQSMGAASANQNRINFSSLLGKENSELLVGLKFNLTNSDIQKVKGAADSLVRNRIKNMLGQSGQSDLVLTQYLATDVGKRNELTVRSEITQRIDTVESSKEIQIDLVVNKSSVKAKTQDQEIYLALDGMIQMGLGLMTYFPADRAFPSGEAAIQIGTADMAIQMNSHIAQPAAKYARLKHYIVSQYLGGEQRTKDLRADFDLIFKELLPGKKLVNIMLKDSGTVAVMIEEIRTGAIFDIDSMSSGEKGLILTFFLMKRATAPGGLILLDEPELHLNPAVCKKILPFLIEHILKANNSQILLCTHSPEILGSAFERSDCTLFHLRTGKDISKIVRKDKKEVFDALEKLGSTTSDVLFSKGGIFLEGKDDIELLDIACGSLLSGYKVAELGGRSEIEKEIKSLQKAESEGKLENRQIFIFDFDRRPTDLKSTTLVKVLQWDRYCIENYLLDFEIIKLTCDDLLKDVKSISSGEIRNILKEIALKQIIGIVSKKIYNEFEFKNLSFRDGLVDSCDSIEGAADILAAKIEEVGDKFKKYVLDDWKAEFLDKAKRYEVQHKSEWEEDWIKKCDGKALLENFHRKMKLPISNKEFKRKIMEAIVNNETENWKTIQGLISIAFS